MTFHNVPTDIPDPEVVPKAKRRKFSAEYKRRILEEADNCTESGQIGVLVFHQPYNSYTSASVCRSVAPMCANSGRDLG
jgi:hypothetical protein